MSLLKQKLQALQLAGYQEFFLGHEPQKSNPQQSKKEESSFMVKDLAYHLEGIKKELGDCQRCRLAKTRTNLVFGVGNPKAELMFIGEAPGRDEDKKGEPFVGRAGQLLTKMIEAMGYTRSEVYIANVIKCRPPENRNPAPDEVETCEPFLLKQIEVIKPKVIVALGTYAMQALLLSDEPIGRRRGSLLKWPNLTVKAKFETALDLESIDLMATYHPAFLLRNASMKKVVWEDLQKVMERLKKP
ncbi:MAG: uracil-DNA glycosylase [Deltaproteobacteria bacterium]|nr:uracil-DNA glycosylase [Deltaproteobacteria bacterium]